MYSFLWGFDGGFGGFYGLGVYGGFFFIIILYNLYM